jgi:hypothetical protein
MKYRRDIEGVLRTYSMQCRRDIGGVLRTYGMQCRRDVGGGSTHQRYAGPLLSGLE